MVITGSDNQIGTLRNFSKKYPDFSYHIDKVRLGKTKVSTGALSIRYLINHYDTISLVGFDFGKTPHYWGVYSPSDIPGKHSWSEERGYVNELIELGKVKLI